MPFYGKMKVKSLRSIFVDRLGAAQQ